MSNVPEEDITGSGPAVSVKMQTRPAPVPRKSKLSLLLTRFLKDFMISAAAMRGFNTEFLGTASADPYPNGMGRQFNALSDVDKRVVIFYLMQQPVQSDESQSMLNARLVNLAEECASDSSQLEHLRKDFSAAEVGKDRYKRYLVAGTKSMLFGEMPPPPDALERS